MPGVRPASAPGQLLFGQKDAALGSAVGSRLHGFGVRRANLIVVMNLLRDGSASYKRSNHFGEQQVGHRAQTVSSRRMSRDINPKPAQLLDQPPDFGAASADLLCDLRAADYYGRVVAKQANDAAQSGVGGCMNGASSASFRGRFDGGIIKWLVVSR